MKILDAKLGPTVVTSTEYRFFDKLRHEKGIYESDLPENEVRTAMQLRQRGLVLRINDNGQAKFKIFPQQADKQI